MALKNLIYILILLLGFPIGLLLAKMCKDEINAWRKRLLIISGICLLLSLILAFIDYSYKFPAVLTLFFVIILNLTIIWKSKK